MADLPVTSDQGAMPVVITDATTTANTVLVNANGSINVNQGTLSATAILTNVASSVTVVTLLAANTSRKGATFYNDGTATQRIKFGSVASATSFNVLIAANAYFEMPLPIYTGIVTMISSNTNGTMRVMELT